MTITDVSSRYLCAGAHLDRAFTRDVIRKILRQPHRAVGPSSGVDTALVLRHCIAAYRRRLLRDAALVPMIAAIAWGANTENVALIVVAVVAAWAVVLLEQAVIRFDILAARLGPHRPEPWLPTSPRLQARLDELAAAECENVVIYNAYEPFVGSGPQVGGWSFVIDLAKGKEELAARCRPEPLDLAEVRARVLDAVHAAGIDGLRADEVIHVSHDRVAELRLRSGTRSGRPIGHLDPAALQHFLDRPSDTCRHFQRFQVTAWGGEIVFTVFLRFVEIRGRLYAEATYTLLSPVAHKWHVVDAIEPAPLPLEILRIMTSSAITTSGALTGAVPRLLSEAWQTWVQQPLQRWEADVAEREGGIRDCATLTTVRQRGASTAYWRHFQRLDQERYVKLLERAVLDTLTAVLDEHGIDTSELVERQTTILNQGVMMTGGSLHAQSLAVGRGARVVAKTRRLAARTRAA